VGEEGGGTCSPRLRGAACGRPFAERRYRRLVRPEGRDHAGGDGYRISSCVLESFDCMERPLIAAVVAAHLRAARRSFLASEDLLAGVAAEETGHRHGRSRKDCEERAKRDETTQHGRTITDRRARCQFKGGYAVSTYLPMRGFSLRRTSAGILARSDQIASARADWQEQSVPVAAASGSARRMSASAFSVAARR